MVSGNVTINSPNTATTTVTPQSNGQIRATYTMIQCNLTVNSDGNGTVTCGGAFDCGVQPSVQATPNKGFVFLNWTVVSGNAVFSNANEASTSVTISGNAVIKANFGTAVAANAFSPKAAKAYDLSVSGNTIKYLVPTGKQGPIKLKIMDMNGKLITEHVGRANISGYFRLNMQNIRKGCYVCSMNAGSYNKVEKIMLVK